MSIHTIGDSHSYSGWQNVTIHHIGPILCYSFGIEKLDRCNIRGFGIIPGDTVVFCFGEIDCRCHIHKHITETRTYQKIIDNIIKNYFEAIELNIEVSKIELKNICVYNIVPPVQKCNTLENPEYPFVGSDEDRKKYVLYFNAKLREKCAEKGYIFFDVYHYYADENGFLKKELSDGHVHIHIGVYIDDFIRERL